MTPLARSEMKALKLGRYPGTNQATRYQPWRGYPYAAVPYLSSHLPCCALIFLRTYPAVPLFFHAHGPAGGPNRDLIELIIIFFHALTLLCAYFALQGTRS